MKAWWESLNEREQKLIGGGAIALVVAVFYWGLWQPVAKKMEHNQKQLTRQQGVNQWARGAVAQLKAVGNDARPGGGSLPQIVNQSSRRFNVQISRINPKGEQLNLLIEDIVFNDLLSWLNYLEHDEGIKIMNLDVSETEVPGKVKVPRLVIEKG